MGTTPTPEPAHHKEDTLPAAPDLAAPREPCEAEADDVTPTIAAGTRVVWVDVATGKTDPMPGTVEQVVSDPADEFPIAVRWADGALFRHTRAELKVVTA